MQPFSSDVEAADSLKADYARLQQEIGKVVFGQHETIRLLITGLFCQGHCLLVGVPGLAKTLLISTISQALDLHFNRIQFTPDLMPSDITGSETMDANRNMRFVRGPVFANIILADEINRTPPKTQAALLEAMQEYTVTVAGVRNDLERPFFVLATQNPIEQEGTYPLPEAQLDRFLFNIHLDYPAFEEEMAIVKATTGAPRGQVENVLSSQRILAYQALVRRVPVADNVVEYAVRLVHKTRPGTPAAAAITQQYIDWGAGPRASQSLVLAAKCHALLQGKYAPDIEDVRAIALPVLRHRLVRNFKAEAEGITMDKIVKELM